jgi:hypothetical protein
MHVGEFREFCVFDSDGKILTREAEWTSAGIFLWLRKSGQRIIQAVPH